MKIRKLCIVLVAMVLLFSLSACEKDNRRGEVPASEAGTLTVTFDFEKQSGYASNQFAVWIEDTDGSLIKTLYVTKFTAKGGYKKRPDAIPVWVEKSGLASMSKKEIDAITGATPKAGTLSYTWDLTDEKGGKVSSGEYRFFVEGSLRWKNKVLYSGDIELGETLATAEASMDYIYEASDDQPALSSDSPENSMIGAVTAQYIPE